jgi:nicotinamide-nucleotide amidase
MEENQTECIIVTIGEEIVSGLITDTNSGWLGRELYHLGVDVREKISVKDREEDIYRVIEYAFSRVPLILMTGGLGPTRDDITKHALMRYFGCAASFSAATYTQIEKLLGQFGRTPTEAHRQQAFLPDCAELLSNRLGTAPGMCFREGGRMLISMPGIPYEMEAIFSDHAPRLISAAFDVRPIFHKILMTAGEGESRLALMIRDIEDNLPEGLSIAYLPGIAQVRIRVSGRGHPPDRVRAKVEETASMIEHLISPWVFGYDNEPLESAVGRLLLERNLTVSTAESCTGGHLAHLITSVAGSSAYYMGSILAYANSIKMDLLGVQETTLAEYGAVSEQTVTEMAQNVRARLGTDYGLATSGIAGPGGVKTRLLALSKSRLINIRYTSVAAMTLLRKFILEAELY